MRRRGPVRGGGGARRVGPHPRPRPTACAQFIPEGTILRPPQISLLASFGRAMVPVYRKPRVAVLSTGDELVELGEPHGHGKIVNSNSHALACVLAEAGGGPLLLGIGRAGRGGLRGE